MFFRNSLHNPRKKATFAALFASQCDGELINNLE